LTLVTMPTRSLPVPDGLDGLRLDAAVSRLFGLSRTAAAALVGAGGVRLDGARPAKGDRVAVGSWLEVALPEPVQPAAPQPVAGLDVVYDDPDLVVVGKPAGVAAHPSPGWDGPTVTGGLAAAGYLLSSSGAAERQGVVHRLDVGTTGLMVLAKSEPAYRLLKEAFRERRVTKRYTALVQGHPDPSSGTIDAPIDRHPAHDYRFAVVAGGRPSVTHYRTVEALRSASLLDLVLETGRTHQIRVHLAAVRHPCVGDLAYGADPVLAARLGLDRQGLHAAVLEFRHPRDDRPLHFESPLPADLATALGRLREQP
jgi:23S rRNA pseudouridine1911/1915/1917 synthase